jgi:hypothetical protein
VVDHAPFRQIPFFFRQAPLSKLKKTAPRLVLCPGVAIDIHRFCRNAFLIMMAPFHSFGSSLDILKVLRDSDYISGCKHWHWSATQGKQRNSFPAF